MLIIRSPRLAAIGFFLSGLLVLQSFIDLRYAGGAEQLCLLISALAISWGRRGMRMAMLFVTPTDAGCGNATGLSSVGARPLGHRSRQPGAFANTTWKFVSATRPYRPRHRICEGYEQSNALVNTRLSYRLEGDTGLLSVFESTLLG